MTRFRFKPVRLIPTELPIATGPNLRVHQHVKVPIQQLVGKTAAHWNIWSSVWWQARWVSLDW